MAVDLRLPQSHSLKEKRAVVKTILQGAARRFGVAVAEVDHHDKWQRAALGFACVASTEAHAREVLDSVERFVWSFPETEVVEVRLLWQEDDQ